MPVGAVLQLWLELWQRHSGCRHRQRFGMVIAAAFPSLDERITTVLAEAQEALPFADLRAKCRVRAATLHKRIGLLATAGRIVKTADGYRLTER